MKHENTMLNSWYLEGGRAKKFIGIEKYRHGKVDLGVISSLFHLQCSMRSLKLLKYCVSSHKAGVNGQSQKGLF